MKINPIGRFFTGKTAAPRADHFAYGGLSSCAPAGEISSSCIVNLNGRWFSELIADLMLGRLQSYSIRHLTRLRDGDIWLELEAKDAGGEGITVKLNMSQVLTNEQQIIPTLIASPLAGGDSCTQLEARHENRIHTGIL